jgi:RNA polymerase sigma-70 factor (ECF subfamily)
MEPFEKVYKLYVHQVFQFVLQRVGRRDMAEDITSEVFLKLYQHWQQIDQSQLPGWLFAVARNSAADYWRHRAVETRYAEQAVGDGMESGPAPSPAGWLFESKELKPIHRLCLVLRYIHDMDRADIAKRTGLTDNQVKSCLQYARTLLRRQILGEQNV